jgi:hypothetical protein
MVNITLSLSEKLKNEMDKFPEINWSEVARSSIKNKLAQLNFMKSFLNDSTMTIEEASEFGEEVSKLLSKKYLEK